MTHVILGDLTVSSVNMALLIARVVVGAVFLAHGINHIYGGGKIEGTGRWFDSLGMRPGILHAWMASLVEVGRRRRCSCSGCSPPSPPPASSASCSWRSSPTT